MTSTAAAPTVTDRAGRTPAAEEISVSHEGSLRTRLSDDPSPTTAALPRWPVTSLLVGFPLWWALGIVDVVWIPVAAVMAAYLGRCRGVRAPCGSGIWLVFLAWSTASVVMVSTAGDLLVFGYRLALYFAGGVLFLYVHNATALTARYLTGCLTAWWVVTVAGGYAGVLLPEVVVRTPLSLLLPQSLTTNELVNHMVVRRLTQYNPDSFLEVAPRPAAPFLYTNNWGNVYSLLLPFVVAYVLQVRRGPRFWILLVLLAASTVPAMLTLNRGMFLGIGLAMAYVTIRAVIACWWRVVGALVIAGAVGLVAYTTLPVAARLEDRLAGSAESTSTDTRASLYLQALRLVADSPFLGHGSPVPGVDPTAAPVGTQGQVWMLLVSHGLVATGCFVGFFLSAFAATCRRCDAVGLACNTVLLVGTVELLYYGVLPYGLPLLMIAAGLGLRRPDRPLPQPLPAFP